MKSLNPCSNGIWSLTETQKIDQSLQGSLNPCSNGIWSLTAGEGDQPVSCLTVLILVLMEYGL